MSLTQRTIFERALDVWGVAAQARQAQEECAELIVAISHFDRGRCTHDAVAEEIADVEIVLAQLRTLVGEDRVNAVKERKFKRFCDRVEEAEAASIDRSDNTESTRWARRMIELEERLKRVVQDAEGRKP